MLMSDFVISLMENWKLDDLPVNIRFGNKYYDIDSVHFDPEINEFMVHISGEVDFPNRAIIINVDE